MSFGIGLTVCIMVGVCILWGIVHQCFFASKENMATAAHKEECARIDQEHKQNLQNYADERQRILAEVAKYN